MSENFSIEADKVQVSYDVVNLYPSVPVNEATNIIIEILSTDPDLKNRTKLNLNDIKELIELCLSKCYFLWEDKIYLMNNSAPIGLALMVVIAEAYLQYHEQRAVETALKVNPPVAPKSLVRYVDDSHARFNDIHSATTFQNILNQQDPDNIKYTMEVNKSLQFLDLRVYLIHTCSQLKVQILPQYFCHTYFFQTLLAVATDYFYPTSMAPAILALPVVATSFKKNSLISQAKFNVQPCLFFSNYFRALAMIYAKKTLPPFLIIMTFCRENESILAI